jgi:hypothetical protein
MPPRRIAQGSGGKPMATGEKRRTMRLLNRIDRLIIYGLLGGAAIDLIASLGAQKVSSDFPYVYRHFFVLVTIALLFWIVYFTIRWLLIILTSGRYAVEALILDNDNRLLLYKHPYHNKLLPPGGRVNLFEFPHDAIVSRLGERLNLHRKDYDFIRAFHPTIGHQIGDIGDVQRVPAPFIVQRELRRQRSLVKFHYDFIYVLRLTNMSIDFSRSAYTPVSFVAIAELRHMADTGRTLIDVVDAYERVLRQLAQLRPPDD